ncbi:MAG: hypothetical protein ACJ74W_17490 [Pyrinomonadaceae bacterium]
MRVEPGEIQIRQLRAHTDARDALALRLQLTSVLAHLNLHPTGLPPTAIVCIRRLRDPLPGALGLTSHTTHSTQRWAQACADSIERCYSRAARPIKGFVPAASESVIFNDQAELLACLAADWCQGRAQSCWWWQALFKQREFTQVLFDAWQRTPEYVPGALAHLAAQEQSARFVRALPVEIALALALGVAQRFGLRALSAVLDRVWQKTTTGFSAHASGPNIISEHLATPARTTAPWRQIVPETQGAQLTPEQQTLLGVGLMLQRAPALVRTNAFAIAVRRWLVTAAVSVQAQPIRPRGAQHTEYAPAQRAHTQPITEPPDRSTHEVTSPAATDTFAQASPPERGREFGAAHSAIVDADVASTPSAPGELERKLAAPIHPSAQTEQEHRMAATELPLTDEADGEAAASHVSMSANTQVDAAASESLALQFAPADELLDAAVDGAFELSELSEAQTGALAETWVAPAEQLLEAEVMTHFGGLFFLINLGLFLELYGDFTAPLAPGLPLPIWDFIALLGERLLGRQLHDDPLWSLLAGLAGRDAHTAPGADFEPPDEWRMDAAWLAPLPRGATWRWAVVRERLQVIHAASFLVIDVPRDERPLAEQLAAEMQAYALHSEVALAAAPEGLHLRGRTPCARWFERLTAYVHVRLRHALGQRNTRATVRQLCVLPARVTLTSTHLDVSMSLGELPVAIRLAGLDRDPGWVPAAGRFVAFHFD